MRRAESASLRAVSEAEEGNATRQKAPRPSRPESASPPAGLCALEIDGLDDARREVTLRLGRDIVPASLDAALSIEVVKTALKRQERLVAQHEEGRWLVLGALRTAPTPGVDEGDEFHIKARRIQVDAEHEFSIVSGAASLVVRATGFVETLAHDITTRASQVHKIIGRLIRLN